MAIFVRGMKCGLCEKPMAPGETVSFPSFVANELDPLWIFNDRTVHTRCFKGHPLAKVASDRLAKFEEASGPGNRTCALCAQPVTNPDEYVPFGFLSDSPPLAQHNYKVVHRQCLGRWKDLKAFQGELGIAVSSGKLKGRAFNWLLEQCSQAPR